MAKPPTIAHLHEGMFGGVGGRRGGGNVAGQVCVNDRVLGQSSVSDAPIHHESRNSDKMDIALKLKEGNKSSTNFEEKDGTNDRTK